MTDLTHAIDRALHDMGQPCPPMSRQDLRTLCDHVIRQLARPKTGGDMPEHIFAGSVDGFGAWHEQRDFVNNTLYLRLDPDVSELIRHSLLRLDEAAGEGWEDAYEAVVNFWDARGWDVDGLEWIDQVVPPPQAQREDT